jgi:hypothetical protein
MTRKLLPYEYDLIDALGVSKEDYLDFVAQQHIYEDVKEGTQLDVRNVPAVAFVLAIVGVLFQVASALLMSKPKLPQQQEGTEQTRDQALSPRLGFNGAQDLAVYGDTVPLVYTNTAQNSNGGVRLSSLLLWSAILSFGNHQFMRLMMTLGAANIARIDPERTALGQFPAKDLVLSNIWQYYNPNGPTRYFNRIRGDANDPTITTANDTTAKLNGLGIPGNAEGFSQAFSPTTANTVGVTGFLPINTDVLILNENGDSVRRRVDTYFRSQDGDYWPDSDNRPVVPVGNRWTLIVPNTIGTPPSSDTPAIARQDALRAAASQIDNAAIFKAGSALFRVVSASYGRGANGIEEGNLTATLECIRAGKLPRARYGLAHWQQVGNRINALRKQINANSDEIGKLQKENAKDQVILSQGYVLVTRRGPRTIGPQRKSLTQADRNFYQNRINTRNNQIANLSNNNSDIQSEINSLTSQGTPETLYVKGLARIEEAAYASVTKCNVLDLALRFQAYRRLSGRSNVYGKNQGNYGHNVSENGLKARTSMFVLWYRFDNTGTYSRLPYIFCCRGFNEQNVFTYVKLVSRNVARFIEVKIEAVVDTFTEIRTFRTRGYCYLNATGPLLVLDADLTGNPGLEVYFNGSAYLDGSRGDYPPFNKSPLNTSEFDLFNYDAFSQTTFSFDSSTEVQLTAVSEQLIEPWAKYSPNLYRGLSTLALHVVSGSGTQDLRSVSAYVTEGKRVRLLPTSLNFFGNEATGAPNGDAISSFASSVPSNSTSFAPDIFLDTVLDRINGIGRYARLHSIDIMQLAQSKRFCQRNRLFMDGVIADGRPWREFWAQVAPFSLLELGKIGGRETLVPALPYVKSTGAITRAISITALFNQGNILDDSFKEEFIDYGTSVQDVVVTLIYRDVERNGIFPRNNSVEIKRTDTQDANAIRESLDISQFVTTRAQAILLGKYLCQVRRFNRRAIEFKTFPTDIFVMPGSYVYVETSNNQWDGIYTGRIEAGGVLNLPIASNLRNGTYNVLTYGSSDGTRSFTNVQVTDGVAATLSALTGQLFVLGQAVRNKRVFRVTEVSMEEEGETTIRAVEHPCDTNGLSFIAQGLDTYVPGLFTIDGKAE